jgi:hypothetical protein
MPNLEDDEPRFQGSDDDEFETVNAGDEMKIIQINDCDWMIGSSLERCKNSYAYEYEPEDIDDARALEDGELNTLTFCDSDENGNLNGDKRTFKEQMEIEIKKGGEFPRLFASTEA